MKVETKYNIGDVFYKPHGKTYLDLHITEISVACTEKGQRTKYSFGTSSSQCYCSYFQDEFDSMLLNKEVFISKKDMLKYYIDILTEE